MKNQPFLNKIQFSLNGIKAAYKTEKSFRTQIVFSFLSILLLIIIRPKAIWVGIFLLSNALVIGTELINTAIEATLDQIHPEKHPLVAKAKDCAAGAVFVASVGTIGVLGAIIYDTFFSF